MRLFTALWLPVGAVAALAADVGPEVPPGWRLLDPSTWHITLAFHGDADPEMLGGRLDSAAVRDVPAPRLRVVGAGGFPGVRWAGVEAAPAGLLCALVVGAGGEPDHVVPHVSVLRSSAGRRRRPAPSDELNPPVPWSGHVGPWWQPADVLLVASEPGPGGSRYRVVHRVPLLPG